jgi:hypothetical protein
VAFAFVGGRWVQCHSEYFISFQGRSEKELALASAELRRRYQCHSQGVEITAKKLAEFLGSVESEEALLVQRLRDREGKKVRDRLSGTANGKAAQTFSAEPRSELTGIVKPTEAPAETDEIYGVF